MTFVIEQVQDGHYYWLLKGGNGQILCASEKTATREECVAAIAEIQVGVRQAVIVDNTLPPT